MITAPAELAEGLLTVAETGRLLHLARTTVYRLMNAGQLQYVRIGKARRIPKAAVYDFVRRNLRGGWKL